MRIPERGRDDSCDTLLALHAQVAERLSTILEENRQALLDEQIRVEDNEPKGEG